MALHITLYPSASGFRGADHEGWYVAAGVRAVVATSLSWKAIYRRAVRGARATEELVRVWWVGDGRASLVLEIAPAPVFRPDPALPDASGM